MYSPFRCDNLRDCDDGSDEEECKFCNYDEFKCLSSQKCVSDKWICDGSDDCEDSSDELNCDSAESEEEENVRTFYDDIQDYNDRSSIDHNDSDGDKIISTGDIAVPIFINPNSTTIDVDESQTGSSSSSAGKIKSMQHHVSLVLFFKLIKFNSWIANLLNRFRSTMRKAPEMTTTPRQLFEETSTSITKKVTSHSTSHSSPCPEDHLRCIEGRCITVQQICDKARL